MFHLFYLIDFFKNKYIEDGKIFYFEKTIHLLPDKLNHQLQ